METFMYCPNCSVKMEFIGPGDYKRVGPSMDYIRLMVYQCPKCKSTKQVS